MGHPETVSFRLFGGLARENGPAPFGGPAQRLLARLLLSPGRSLSRHALSSSLWPRCDSGRARFYLRRALLALRSELGRELALDATKESVSLRIDPQTVDVHRFDRLVREGSPEALRHAVALHVAPLLDAWDDDWLVPERESRRLAWHAALETLGRFEIERGRPAEAVRLLGLAVAREPLRESAQRLYLEALRLAGDVSQAERHYDRFERRLKDELGFTPSPETRKAAHAVPLVPSQDAHDGETRRRMPVPAPAFFGRAAEIRTAQDALARSRLVTLVGPGGIGKTRLALACAEAQGTGFDLVAFVDLASREDGRSLAALLARSTGAPTPNGVGSFEAARRHLSGRRALLVLDNCEHILEAAGRLALDVLERLPETTILATSRQPLGLTEEAIVDVPPLDLDAAEAWFRDCAARKGRPIPDGRASRETVRQICEAVECLPLAIALATGALRTVSLDELAEDVYGVLHEGGGSRLRHRSMRAATDWSYRTLSVEEIRLLLGVSPIHGHWTAEYAWASVGPAVGSLDEAKGALRRLVEKSLVTFEEDALGGTYRLLVPIREDAYRRLVESGEEEAVRGRLRESVLARSEALYRATRGHLQYGERAMAEREIHVFESVLHDCLRTEEGRRAGIQIVMDAPTTFLLTFRYREAAAIQERMLESSTGLASNVRSRALAQIVHFRADWGEAAQLDALASEAVTAGRESEDPTDATYPLASQGMVFYYTGRYGAALEAFDAALELSRKAKNPEGVFSLSLWVGKAACAIGEFAVAERSFDEAARQTDFCEGRGAALVTLNLGRLRYREGRYDEALALFREAEVAFATVGDSEHAAAAEIGRAACALRHGDPREAKTLATDAEARASRLLGDITKLYDGLGTAGLRDEMLAIVFQGAG